jgi:hypothetical protein
MITKGGVVGGGGIMGMRKTEHIILHSAMFSKLHASKGYTQTKS